MLLWTPVFRSRSRDHTGSGISNLGPRGALAEFIPRIHSSRSAVNGSRRYTRRAGK
jgi:hypothetical protein